MWNHFDFSTGCYIYLVIGLARVWYQAITRVHVDSSSIEENQNEFLNYVISTSNLFHHYRRLIIILFASYMCWKQWLNTSHIWGAKTSCFILAFFLFTEFHKIINTDIRTNTQWRDLRWYVWVCYGILPLNLKDSFCPNIWLFVFFLPCYVKAKALVSLRINEEYNL